MGESVQVRCPECLRTLRYAAPAFPCSCGRPIAPPVIAGAVAAPITHRNWSDEWVTVHCPACTRASDWPHPEVGCPCGAVLRVPVEGPGGPEAPEGPGGPETAPGAAPDAGAGGAGAAPPPWATGPGGHWDAKAVRDGAADGRAAGRGRDTGAADGSAAGTGRGAGAADGSETGTGRGAGAADESETGTGTGTGRDAGTAAAAAGTGTGTDIAGRGDGFGSGLGHGPDGDLDPHLAPESRPDPRHGPGPDARPDLEAVAPDAYPASFARRHPSPLPPPAPAPARPAPGPAAPRSAFRPVTIRTARDAVAASAGYLRWLGFKDVVQPEERSASAVDLRGPGLVAQVDPSTRPTGLRAVECLWLNGLSNSAVSVYFSLAGYTPEAHERAEGLGIPLFVLDLTGTPQPVNAPAGELLTTGAP
ncbi:hypothetical protein [Streptomyces sp. NPDC056069]|uniref:hypothetical protein n=1 Tax=Streptomyces sp. NPDC056069 TaxID=3345702 RepID=UPI0035DB63E1